MQASVQRSPQDLIYIDSVRGLCALYVAACHAYLMYSSSILEAASGPIPRGLVWSTIWLVFGRVAVAIFIVISGYCLMLPIVRSESRIMQRTWFQFMRRRARRLLPPYFGALAVSIALIAVVPALSDPAIGEWSKSFPALTVGSILSHGVLLHNFSEEWQYSINHPMWSIATEWQIYFFFPGLVWIWSRFGIGKLIIASLAICVGLLAALIVFGFENNPWPPEFFALFGFGMAAAAYNYPQIVGVGKGRQHAERWGRRALWLFALAVAVNVLFLFVGEKHQVSDFIIGGAMVCALIYLTQAVQDASRSRVLQFLESSFLVHLGSFSYSLYLLHAPVLALVFLIARELGLGFVMTQLFILGVGLPLSVIASYVFHLVFERPFMSSRAARPISQRGRGNSPNLEYSV